MTMPNVWSEKFGWGTSSRARVTLEHALGLAIDKLVTNKRLYEAIEVAARLKEEP
jgi:hypothetical protein